ncbi:MAG: hypothetical protein JW772_05090 [Candidatus Diapherotrites archaeon]|nr:hypothetical protein [Candidatus Diapherotrites archaeon]
MKHAFLLLAILLCAGLVFADLGPSPSYSFGISNTGEFPEYAFYYISNIWQDTPMEVRENTNVYKLGTHITVYAIPRSEFENLSMGVEMHPELLELSVKSQEIDLKSGHTVFEVQNFDASAKTMQLAEKSHEPEPVPDFLVEMLLVVIGVVAVLAVIAIVIVFVARRGAKK